MSMTNTLSPRPELPLRSATEGSVGPAADEGFTSGMPCRPLSRVHGEGGLDICFMLSRLCQKQVRPKELQKRPPVVIDLSQGTATLFENRYSEILQVGSQ